MKIIAIIPARSGSKRIKNKNSILLGGKPLIEYAIEAAKNSRYINKIVVSTNDERVVEISQKQGVEVIKRPEELANDNSPVIGAIKHVLDSLKEKEEYYSDIVVLLQPTSPLRTVEDIDDTIKLALDTNADSAETFCKVEDHPACVFKVDENKNAFPLDKENYLKRSQDLPILYKENGAVYVIKTSVLTKNNTLYGKNHKAFIMPRKRSIDVDNLIDLQLVETILNKNEN